MSREQAFSSLAVGRFVLLLFLISASTAMAAPGQAILRQAKDMSDQAARHFAHKEYLQAAELFEQAYALDHNKLIRLRNAGRAFEEAGRDERALHCFLRYLELGQDAQLLGGGPGRSVRVRAAIASKKASEKAAANPKQAPVAVAHAVTATDDAVEGRPAGMVLVGGGGLALLAAGLIWAVATESAAGGVDQDEEQGHYNYAGGDGKLSEDRSTIGTNRVASWSIVGLGTTAMVTATWLWLRESEATPAAWPQMSVGGQSVRFAWRF